MRQRVRYWPRFASWPLGWLVLGLGAPLALPAGDWQSLLANSPFGQTNAGPAATTNELEFRGIVQEGSHYIANLYDPTTKKSNWIPVSGGTPGLTVNSYDARSDVLFVTQGARKLSLPLKISRIAKLDIKSAPAATAENANTPPDPADRRREMREWRRQMANGENPGPPPFFRNMPPEAQAMIQELRRRRQAAAGQNQDQNQAQNNTTSTTTESSEGPLPLPPPDTQ